MNAAARSTETAVFLAWLVALVASAGALFLGEVMGKTPLRSNASMMRAKSMSDRLRRSTL